MYQKLEQQQCIFENQSIHMTHSPNLPIKRTHQISSLLHYMSWDVVANCSPVYELQYRPETLLTVEEMTHRVQRNDWVILEVYFLSKYTRFIIGSWEWHVITSFINRCTFQIYQYYEDAVERRLLADSEGCYLLRLRWRKTRGDKKMGCWSMWLWPTVFSWLFLYFSQNIPDNSKSRVTYYPLCVCRNKKH